METKPTGMEAAKEVFGDDLPECDRCGEVLGTGASCLQCLYAYESHLRTLGYDV